MFETTLFALLIVAVSVSLLGVRLLLKSKKSFPEGHVSSIPKLRKMGIGCAQSQDYEAQHRAPVGRLRPERKG